MVEVINPAAFRERLTIQAPSVTKDGRGQAITTFADWQTVWAKVKETASAENDNANRLQGVKNYAVTIRHFSGITLKHRLLYNGNTLDITSLVNQGRNQYIEITAISREK